MGWQDFKLLVSYIGVPGAMMGVMVYALCKGLFISAREAKYRDEFWLKREAEWEQTSEARETEWHGRYLKLEAERDMWRSSSLKHLGLAERAVETAKTAANKVGD